MLDGFVGGIVPFERVVAVREVDVGFVEDGGPLKGGGCGVLISILIYSRVEGGVVLAYHAASGTWCNGTVCCPAAPAD